MNCELCGYPEGDHAIGCSHDPKTRTPRQGGDAVNHPIHYNKHPSNIECIEVVRHMNFNLGNVVKYIWRADEKGATLQDLKKALFYLQDEIKRREGEQVDTYEL